MKFKVYEVIKKQSNQLKTYIITIYYVKHKNYYT